MRRGLLLASIMIIAGCAQHRLIVPRPDPTGQAVTVDSNAFGLGLAQKRTVAECPTNLLAEVRVHQNLMQSIASLVTLGLWMPTRIEYRCAKRPQDPAGEFDPVQK